MESLTEQREKPVPAVAVLHVGGGDQNDQQQAERIDGEVTLTAIDPFRRVETAAGRGHGRRGTYRLGINDR